MTMKDESEALELVAKTMAKRLAHNRVELTLSNGIVLSFRAVSPILTSAIRNELDLKIPKPPRVWLEDKGREEENPNDPAYLAALERQQYLNDIAMSDAITYAGVEIKYVPEHIFRPEQDGWLEDPRVVVAKYSGLEFDKDDQVKRKVVWLRIYAIESYVDARMWDEVQIDLVGMREEEVQEALVGFRHLPERGTDNVLPFEAVSENGNTDNRATRRSRSRVRGA